MSRHVPLMFRDPFLRDVDRDFWGGDRVERRFRDYMMDSPSRVFDQVFSAEKKLKIIYKRQKTFIIFIYAKKRI